MSEPAEPVHEEGSKGGAAEEAPSAASERATQLSKVPFFDGLSAEALAMIANVTTEESHAPGTKLFGYGEPGDKLYILDGKPAQ